MVENRYFDLFRGEDVPLSEITSSCPNMAETIRSLVKTGTVIGQYTLEEDIILWMPNKKREINQMHQALDRVMEQARQSGLRPNGLPK